jgi:hypothetical protein
MLCLLMAAKAKDAVVLQQRAQAATSLAAPVVGTIAPFYHLVAARWDALRDHWRLTPVWPVAAAPITAKASRTIL